MRAGLISYEQQWDQVVSIILMIKPVCAVHCQKEISTRPLWGKKKLGGGANQCTLHHTGPTFDFLQSSYVQANIIWAMETQMSSVCVCVWWGGGSKLRPGTWSFVSSPLPFRLIPFFPSHLSSDSSCSAILPFPLTLPVSAVCHTGPVHLLVDSVSVISCGSCWGRWPAGVLWCNDPCHCLPPPPVIEGEKWIEGNGASINTHKETHCWGSGNL